VTKNNADEIRKGNHINNYSENCAAASHLVNSCDVLTAVGAKVMFFRCTAAGQTAALLNSSYLSQYSGVASSADNRDRFCLIGNERSCDRSAIDSYSLF
jgi:hypothetical protein